MTGKLTIGYTLPDPGGGYQPILDGYRPGATQRTVVLDLDHPGRLTSRRGWTRIVARVSRATTPHQWADAAYTATNAPLEVLEADPRLAVWLIWAAIAAQPALRAVMRPICVGDTVTVTGHALACAHAGWVQVPDPGRLNRKDPG